MNSSWKFFLVACVLAVNAFWTSWLDAKPELVVDKCLRKRAFYACMDIARKSGAPDPAGDCIEVAHRACLQPKDKVPVVCREEKP